MNNSCLTLTMLNTPKCNKCKKLLHLVALSREQKNHCSRCCILLHWAACTLCCCIQQGACEMLVKCLWNAFGEGGGLRFQPKISHFTYWGSHWILDDSLQDVPEGRSKCCLKADEADNEADARPITTKTDIYLLRVYLWMLRASWSFRRSRRRSPAPSPTAPLCSAEWISGSSRRRRDTACSGPVRLGDSASSGIPWNLPWPSDSLNCASSQGLGAGVRFLFLGGKKLQIKGVRLGTGDFYRVSTQGTLHLKKLNSVLFKYIKRMKIYWPNCFMHKLLTAHIF